MISSDESWRDIAGYEGYYSISDHGRVRSDRFNRILKPFPKPSGYLLVSLCRNGVGANLGVHGLVLKAFVGPRLDGYECAHLNGIRDDNRLSNLKWVTHLENELQKIPHGTSGRKLTPELVRQLRHDVGSGNATMRGAAKSFGLNFKTVRSVVKCYTWKHVT